MRPDVFKGLVLGLLLVIAINTTPAPALAELKATLMTVGAIGLAGWLGWLALRLINHVMHRFWDWAQPIRPKHGHY